MKYKIHMIERKLLEFLKIKFYTICIATTLHHDINSIYVYERLINILEFYMCAKINMKLLNQEVSRYVPYLFKNVGNMPIEDMHPEPRDIAVGWPVPYCPALTSQRLPVPIHR